MVANNFEHLLNLKVFFRRFLTIAENAKGAIAVHCKGKVCLTVAMK